MAASVRVGVVAFAWIASLMLVRSDRPMICSDNGVRNFTNESCVVIRNFVTNSSGTLRLKRNEMGAICQKFHGRETKWTLPSLDSWKLSKLRDAINATLDGLNQNWTFWMSLERDMPTTEDEKLNFSLWSDANKWRWGKNGGTLNETYPDPSQPPPWARCNMTPIEPNNDAYINDPKKKNLELYALSTLQPNGIFTWYGAPAVLDSADPLAEMILQHGLLVCEGERTPEPAVTTTVGISTSGNTVPGIVDESPEPDEESTIHWIVLGVCLAAGLVGSVVIIGVCYVKRRGRRTAPSTTVTIREDHEPRGYNRATARRGEGRSSRKRDDSLSERSDSASSFRDGRSHRGREKARRVESPADDKSRR